MFLTKLRVSNFRNYKDHVFSFGDGISTIVGPNATGKTNILESIFVLSTGKSFKARIEAEMINYKVDIARAKCQYNEANAIKNLEVILTRGVVNIENIKKVEGVRKKKLLVDGVGKRLIDFAGNLKVTLFGPWDMNLVTQSPSLRRKFLDTVLSQVDREYRRASLSYEKGLRQRNKVLWFLRENSSFNTQRERLIFWDKLLIKNGDYIAQKRTELIDFINQTEDFIKEDFELEYDKNAVSEGRLEQYKKEEIAAAKTLVGPHRDDFIFKIQNPKSKIRNLANYGSRGEQRMGILWLKLAELAFVEAKTGERPVLLLDDIFSELDHEHRKVVSEVAKKQQTIITTADPHFVEGFEKAALVILK